jgi:hypothetical protein
MVREPPLAASADETRRGVLALSAIALSAAVMCFQAHRRRELLRILEAKDSA